MSAQCVVPGCAENAAASLRADAPVCLDHYWTVRYHLERLGQGLLDYRGSVHELIPAALAGGRQDSRYSSSSV